MTYAGMSNIEMFRSITSKTEKRWYLTYAIINLLNAVIPHVNAYFDTQKKLLLLMD